MNLRILIILITGLSFFTLSFSDTNGVWTYAEDIVGGEFGADENSTNFTFSDVVYFNQDLIYKSTKIEDLFVNRSGDSMSGVLDMTNNNITNIGSIYTNASTPDHLGGVFAEAYYTRGEGNTYYLRPANTSVINNLDVDGAILSDLDLSGNNINNVETLSTEELCGKDSKNCINISKLTENLEKNSSLCENDNEVVTGMNPLGLLSCKEAELNFTSIYDLSPKACAKTAQAYCPESSTLVFCSSGSEYNNGCRKVDSSAGTYCDRNRISVKGLCAAIVYK